MRAFHAANDPAVKSRSILAERTSPAMRLVASNGSAEIQDGGNTGKLLERDAQLDTLANALSEAGTGSGRIALVHGEAGIGKTALVESFLAIGGFANQLHISFAVYQSRNPLAQQGVIVNR